MRKNYLSITKSLFHSLYKVAFVITLLVFFIASTNQVKAADITDGRVGYWKLDDGSGTKATDSSPNGYTGTLTNGPVWNTLGQVDGALNFDGTNDYVTIPSNSNLNRGNASVTVAFWMKRGSTGTTYGGLVCKTSGSWCAYGMDKPSNPRVLIRNSSGAKSYGSGITVSPDVWTHIAFSIEDTGSSSIIKTYKNGVLQNTTTNALRVGSSTSALFFGRRDIHYLQGSLDEVRVYNRVLSDSEIAEIAVFTGGTQTATPEPTPTPQATPTPTPIVTPTPIPSPSSTPIPGEAFTIAVLPDTQKYSLSYPQIFTSQTQWLVQNKASWNIAYLLHVGDLVDHQNSSTEWDNANTSMSVLDGNINYTMALGNHDFYVSSARSSIPFNQYFPVSRYQNLPTFGGVFDPAKHDNSYYFFSAGGVDFLVISLEFGPRNAVLDWANQVASQYPNKKVILVTHDYLYYDNTLHGSDPSHLYGPEYWPSLGDYNNGVNIWEKFVKLQPNMLFVFSGHVHTPTDGEGTLVSNGVNGNKVYQIMGNYQDFPNGGNGWLKLVTINPTAKTVAVKTYSPYLSDYRTGPDNEFEFTNVNLITETDTTPPSVPQELAGTALNQQEIGLTWQPAQDNESGVSLYKIYRDNTLIGNTQNTTFTDTGLSDSTAYSYEVSAVNGSGAESGRSNATVITTLSDTTAPSISSVAVLNSTSVEAAFSETVSVATAQDPLNYAIDNGITVSAAALSADGQKVTLIISPLTGGVNYTLTVNNVTDRATVPNPIIPDSQYMFTYASAPTTGLIGHWKLDETTGTLATDSINSINATLVNGPFWIAGQIGNALKFDGTNDHAVVPYNAIYDRANSSVTVSFWLYRQTGATNYSGIVCKKSGSWCAYGMDSPPTPRVLIRNSTGAKSYSGGFTVAENTWTHVAFSIEDTGSNTTIRTYKDGQLVKTTTGGLRLPVRAEGINFGRRDVHYLNGTLDDIRIYDRVLSDDEIKDIARSGGAQVLGVSIVNTNDYLAIGMFMPLAIATLIALRKSPVIAE